MGLCRASVISPIPNKIAIEKAKVRAPLMVSAITMLRGTTIAEFVTSSPIRELLASYSEHRLYFKDACLLIWLVPSTPKNVSLGKNNGLHILTNERPSGGQQAKTPRETVVVPPAGVLKIRKDESGSASG